MPRRGDDVGALWAAEEQRRIFNAKAGRRKGRRGGEAHLAVGFNASPFAEASEDRKADYPKADGARKRVDGAFEEQGTEESGSDTETKPRPRG